MKELESKDKSRASGLDPETLLDIESRVNDYCRELSARYRRKEDEIIIGSEAKRYRDWLFANAREKSEEEALPPTEFHKDVRDEILISIEAQIEEDRKNLEKKSRRKEDQVFPETFLEKYRNWLMGAPSGDEMDQFVKYRPDEEQKAAQGPTILDQRYEILSKIGSGNRQGCIYKARDRRLKCITAIRAIVAPEVSGAEHLEVERRFIREANLLFNLHHSGLPKISDFFVGKDPETGKSAYFLVMTFIEGKSMETLMLERKLKPLPQEEVKAYFRQALDILSFLNSRIPPIIYKDMKASNVLVQGRTSPPNLSDSGSVKMGRVFLLDFGVARILSSGEEEPGKKPARDLVSLASIMYFLLTGKNIEISFSSPRMPRPIRDFNPKVSDKLEQIVMSIFADFIESRHDSPERIIALLEGRKKIKPDKISPGLFESPESIPLDGDFDSEPFPEPHRDSLHQTVGEGDLVSTDELLNKGVPVDERDELGWTPLHLAAVQNNQKIMKLLISAGADLNARNEDGSTPLHMVAQKGLPEAVEILIQSGAQVGAKDNEGHTPLHLVGSQQNGRVAEMLIDAWVSSVFANHDKASAASNLKEGSTELHIQAAKGAIKELKALLAQGYFMDPRNEQGMTPLHLAAIGGHGKIVELLLKRGADPIAMDVYGNTPADLAQKAGFEEIAETLFKVKESGSGCQGFSEITSYIKAK